MDLKSWPKTSEGVEIIIGQRQLFCTAGQLYQGYNQVPVEVDEVQVTDAELADVMDLDGTLDRVHFRRRQRLESREMRKQKEYDERRAALRAQRRNIVEEIKESKAAGIPSSPDVMSELSRIDGRLSRLADVALRAEVQAAADRVDPLAAEAREAAEKAEEIAQRLQCAECEAMSPEGHHNPANWLRGHRMGQHKKQRVAS